MNYEIKNVWSVLLRLFHWSLVLSIIALAVTGFYINTPWTNTTLEGSVSFPMATMRYLHFVAGYLFTAAVMVRLFLYIFGNRHERVWDILPFTSRNIKSLITTVGYYSYISDEHDSRLGHNVLAGVTYLLTFVAALFQLSSGFYMLFPEAGFWQSFGGTIFGTQQDGRFLHHLLMWYFILFAFAHVYLVIWNDLRTPEGLVSSMFNGKKFKHKNV
jgi:Ni/Fe-hydrogenase 1 B-type cytochrome subunit